MYYDQKASEDGTPAARDDMAPPFRYSPMSEPEILNMIRQQRADWYKVTFKGGARALAHLLRTYVIEPYLRYRDRSNAIRELSLLSDDLLKDIGLSRSEIPAAVDGKLARVRMKDTSGGTALSEGEAVACRRKDSNRRLPIRRRQTGNGHTRTPRTRRRRRSAAVHERRHIRNVDNALHSGSAES